MNDTRTTARWRYILTIPAACAIAYIPSLITLPLLYLDMNAAARFVLLAILQIGLSFLLVYLYNHYVLHRAFSDIRVRRPGPQWRWIALIVLVMAVSMGLTILLTEGTLYLDDMDTASLIATIAYRLMIPGAVAGVTEELLMRGFLLGSLEQIWSRRTAIVVSVLTFTVLHASGVLEYEDPLTLVWTYAVIAILGLLLTLVTLETGSIWTTAIMHALLNQYGWIRIMPEGTEFNGQEIYIYSIAAPHRWMSGSMGANNMQGGVPALIGYALLILLALHLLKRQK